MKKIIKYALLIVLGILSMILNIKAYKVVALLKLNFNLKNKSVPFSCLPEDVQTAFIDRYDYFEPPRIVGTDTFEYYVPFVEAKNLSGDTVIISPTLIGQIGLDNHYYIKSNKRVILSDMSVLEGVYIIKNDSIYYPVNGYGISTDGYPRSFHVQVDTLRFGRQKMITDW